MINYKIPLALLRIGIAIPFLYAAIGSFLAPENWIGYFPTWLRDMLPENLLLTGFSLFEIALAIWLISNWKIFYAAILAAITLAGIIAANTASLDILFRDTAILFAAIALSEFSRLPQNKL